MILKTNSESCYFYCGVTKKKSTQFIDSPKLHLYYINNNGVENIISNVYIDSRYNIIIGKDINGTSYIIDDGARNTLVRSGYMVYENFDSEKITDKNIGESIHEKLIDQISQAIMNNDYCKINKDGQDYTAILNGYNFTIRLYNNIDIVRYNQERKINSLPFYPFDKNMDNYGTIYVAIYCKKIGSIKEKNSIIADNILKAIVDKTKDVKYVPLDLKSNPIYFSIG